MTDARPIREGSSDSVLARYWFPACSIGQLDQGNPIGVLVCDVPVVVWRSSTKLMAWKDQCAHRGAKLSLGKTCVDRLRCPYHGWEFDEEGNCVLIPSDPDGRIPQTARARETYLAVEHAGLVWLNFSADPRELRLAPEFTDSEYGVAVAGPIEMETSAMRLCENFLDVSHIPFVHDGLLGNAADARVPEYTVNISEQGVSTDDVVISIPDSGDFDKMVEATAYYEVLSPTVVYLARNNSGSSDSTSRKVLMLAVRPLSETRCCAFFSLAWHGEKDRSWLDEIIQFDVEVLMQDKPIVETQQPKRLPLQHSEIHLKSDALTSAYRRYLTRIGVAYGTQ